MRLVVRRTRLAHTAQARLFPTCDTTPSSPTVTTSTPFKPTSSTVTTPSSNSPSATSKTAAPNTSPPALPPRRMVRLRRHRPQPQPVGPHPRRTRTRQQPHPAHPHHRHSRRRGEQIPPPHTSTTNELAMARRLHHHPDRGRPVRGSARRHERRGCGGPPRSSASGRGAGTLACQTRAGRAHVRQGGGCSEPSGRAPRRASRGVDHGGGDGRVRGAWSGVKPVGKLAVSCGFTPPFRAESHLSCARSRAPPSRATTQVLGDWT